MYSSPFKPAKDKIQTLIITPNAIINTANASTLCKKSPILINLVALTRGKALRDAMDGPKEAVTMNVPIVNQNPDDRIE